MRQTRFDFNVYLAFSALSLVGLIELGLSGRLVLFWLYIGMSLFTFVVFAKDKYAAIKGKWRTPEIGLQLLSLFGGWPGALMARSWFRHKSQKQPFTAVLWLLIVFNVVLFAVALTPQGIELTSHIYRLAR